MKQFNWRASLGLLGMLLAASAYATLVTLAFATWGPWALYLGVGAIAVVGVVAAGFAG